MAAGIKKLAEITEKCKEPADKTAECIAKAGEEAKMCGQSCMMCTSHSSTLILGAAAVATAMLLI